MHQNFSFFFLNFIICNHSFQHVCIDGMHFGGDSFDPFWFTEYSLFIHSRACRDDDQGVIPLSIGIWVLLMQLPLYTQC